MHEKQGLESTWKNVDASSIEPFLLTNQIGEHDQFFHKVMNKFTPSLMHVIVCIWHFYKGNI